MRVTMFPVVESEIEFDFSSALSCQQHDKTHTVIDGVDFILEEGDEVIWLEVKNFEKRSLPAKMRGGARRSFLAKLKTNRTVNKKKYRDFYIDELRAKFIGTLAALWLSGTPPTKPILYIVLLESPRFDSALKLHANSRMNTLIPSRGSVKARWIVPTPVSTSFPHPPVRVAVMDSTDWNDRFPAYAARVL